MMHTLGRAALALTLLAAPLGAQTVDAGPRWTGWLGCWSIAPADMQAIDRPGGARLVCVTPTADANVANVSLIADGKEFFRDTIDASGTPRAVERNSCKGSERATWSLDGRRVYLKSSMVCGHSATDVAAIMSLTPSGDWLDVRSISTDGATQVRVTRYHDVGTPALIPATVASVVTERAAAIKSARTAAAAKLKSDDIVEAWRIAGTPALVEAWIYESGLGMPVDARGLEELAAAGVPAQITDAMVAVDRSEKSGSGRRYANYHPFDDRLHCYGCEKNRGWDQGTGQRVIFEAWQYEDPWNFSIFSGFFGPYGNFGYPNRVRGNDATYGIIGAGSARSGVRDLRPPVLVLANDIGPKDAKAQPSKDEGAGKQVADAISGAAEQKGRSAKAPTSPKSAPRK